MFNLKKAHSHTSIVYKYFLYRSQTENLKSGLLKNPAQEIKRGKFPQDHKNFYG